MSNMSYCRWQNTLSDLKDCAADLELRSQAMWLNREFPDHEQADDMPRPLGRDEREARSDLLQLAAQMLMQIGIDIDENDVSSAISAMDALEIPQA